jgi:zinc protease
LKAFVVAVCLLGAAAGLTAQTDWPSERPPRPLSTRDVNFPPYQIQTLPNGLRVVAVLHHEQPVVSLRMIVGAGSALDPQDKLGMAQLAASLLTQGTTTQSATELNEAVDFMGAIMGAGAGSDHTLLNMVVMKDSFQNGLRMLSDLARRPAFAAEEIERQRQQTLSSLTVSFEDPAFVADAVFGRLVYGFHPYGLPQSGTPQTIGGITRDDLVDFHRKYFVPNNSILAVVGDVTAEAAFGGVKAAFEDWERKELPPSLVTDPPEPTRRVIIVNKPDAVQTEVRAGHIGVRRNHPDYMALNLATRILGGEGANRLHQVLRTERGLTYGAQADMHVLKEAGDFEASTNTRSEATGQVLRLVVDEFWKLVRERVGERELGDAKAYMAGSFPLTIEIPDAIATRVLNVLFYGLPVDELQTFRERVNAVTAEEIHRVARLTFRPDRLSIVLVGNAAAFTGELKRIGFETFEVVDIGDLDLTAADFRRRGNAAPRRPAAALQPSPRDRQLAYQQAGSGVRESARPARALLDAVIAAKGGLETLRALTTIKAATTTTMTTPGGEVKTETTTWLQYPNRVRVETRLPEATIVQVYDGQRAWIQDPAGTHQVPNEAVREMEISLRRDTIALLLAAHDGTVNLRLLPDVKDGSGTVQRALEFSGTVLEPIVLYVDPATHLVSRQAYVAGGPGEPLVEEVFSDYRNVDGVQIAFTAAVRRGGQPILERRITDVTLRSRFEPSLFKRPGS